MDFLNDIGLKGGTSFSVGVSTVDVGTIVARKYGAAVWEVIIQKGTARQFLSVYAVHDGTAAADAVNKPAVHIVGAQVGTIDVTLDVVLSGTGASQVMKLQATGTSASWTVTVTTRAFKLA